MRFHPAWLFLLVPLAAFVALLLLNPEFEVPENFPVLQPEEIGPEPGGSESELATFGSGCFWCTEAVFRRMQGVRTVVSGYSGGDLENPTYAQVCREDTGHAEVVQITFDPRVVTYAQLLEVFWRSHDPTTPDRQGNDVGPQYRSVIFHHSDRQRELAERYKRKIDEAGVFRSPLVTEIVPYRAFYPAEKEHQDYYARNSRQGYCRAVIRPKLEKLEKVFADRMKPE